MTGVKYMEACIVETKKETEPELGPSGQKGNVSFKNYPVELNDNKLKMHPSGVPTLKKIHPILHS